MTKVIILGAGAAPGVPSLSCGWGACNPLNPKNCRLRTSTYYKIGQARILVDTSPDLRIQLLTNQIRQLDGVLFTHTHADHLNGIDELREINRINLNTLDIFAVKNSLEVIEKRFSYLISRPQESKNFAHPNLVANEIVFNQPFYIKDVKITPLKLIGHNDTSTGYAFNDGEIVHIADFKAIDDSAFEQIKVRPKLLIIPLTTPLGQRYHAGLVEVLKNIEKINPQQTIINHMASECDYDAVNQATPENVTPAYDNMTIQL